MHGPFLFKRWAEYVSKQDIGLKPQWAESLMCMWVQN